MLAILTVLVFLGLLFFAASVMVMLSHYLLVRPHPPLKLALEVFFFCFTTILINTCSVTLFSDTAFLPLGHPGALTFSLAAAVSEGFQIVAMLRGIALLLGWVVRPVARWLVMVFSSGLVVLVFFEKLAFLTPWLPLAATENFLVYALGVVIVALGIRFHSRLFPDQKARANVKLLFPGLILLALVLTQVNTFLPLPWLPIRLAKLGLWSLFGVSMGWWCLRFGLRLMEAARNRVPASEPSVRTFGAAFGLSKRELELCELLLQGLVLKEVAARMGISTNTARNHNANLFRKVGVSTRMELVNKVLRHPGASLVEED